MNPRSIFLAITLVACGSQSAEQAPATPSEPGPHAAYDLHEWGLLSASLTVVELAAGPGSQPIPRLSLEEMTVDKPVVYVHATAPTRFSLNVALGDGYGLAERWPGVGTPITWQVDARPGACAQLSPYPQGCQSVDGYCETRELALYQTNDASCLVTDDVNASLLFYRLRATSPGVAARLPVQMQARQLRARTPRTAWRIQNDGVGNVLVRRFELSDRPVDLAPASEQGASAAMSWTHEELGRLGLSDDERAAFERAWWPALFDADVAVQDLPPADSPVRAPDVDDVLVDETTLDRRTTDMERENAHSDVLLYFLTASEIDDIARLEATPPPRATHRAFLVRQDLR